MSGAFQTKAPAKWVLTGEHAVLRGATAIAFPHPELSLSLRFEPGGSELCVVPPDAKRLVKQAWSLEDASLDMSLEGTLPRGTLTIESSIPRGAGLGSSAAFAVAASRWITAARGASDPGASSRLAKKIEDHLHGGSSSGMDVAAILSDGPISYRAGQAPSPLRLRKLPRFSLHDTGLRASTAACIAKVAAFRAKDLAVAADADLRMTQASALAEAGLRAFDGGQRSGLGDISEAMRRAESCFSVWGLEPPQATALIQDLESRGALAAKLTGAGGGGMVVALWGD